jgi:acetyl-CoA carboxylase biotin carboxyl carrier protein
MDIEEIKQLVQLMADNALSELNITDGEKQINLKRGGATVVAAQAALAPLALAPAPAAAVAPAAPAAPADNYAEVRSPMVGTFYAAPSPDSEPFVKIGMSLNNDSPVCIIEAMKVMNEIRSECSGTVMEICVRNAQPVEFGQVLFRVKPA